MDDIVIRVVQDVQENNSNEKAPSFSSKGNAKLGENQTNNTKEGVNLDGLVQGKNNNTKKFTTNRALFLSKIIVNEVITESMQAVNYFGGRVSSIEENYMMENNMNMANQTLSTVSAAFGTICQYSIIGSSVGGPVGAVVGAAFGIAKSVVDIGFSIAKNYNKAFTELNQISGEKSFGRERLGLSDMSRGTEN